MPKGDKFTLGDLVFAKVSVKFKLLARWDVTDTLTSRHFARLKMTYLLDWLYSVLIKSTCPVLSDFNLKVTAVAVLGH